METTTGLPRTGDLYHNPINGEEVSSEVNPWDFDAIEEKDLTPKEIRGIKWRGKQYVLKRASADAVIRFNNKRFQQAKMDDGSLIGVTGGAELPAFLVSMCLFEVLLRQDGTEQLKSMNDSMVRANWPPHYIDKLFEQAKKISHIDDDNRTLDQKIADTEKQLTKLIKERDRLNPPRIEGRQEHGDEKLVEVKLENQEDLVGNS